MTLKYIYHTNILKEKLPTDTCMYLTKEFSPDLLPHISFYKLFLACLRHVSLQVYRGAGGPLYAAGHIGNKPAKTSTG